RGGSVRMLRFFFCQAEDGIRYWSVTGVQTCALPILFGRQGKTTRRFSLPAEHAAFLTRSAAADNMAVFAQYVAIMGGVEDDIVRSEERRVGKEGRSLW